jgi:hypothetical protein
MVATFVNTAVGASNPAVVDFDFNTARSANECAAAILGYIGKIGGSFAVGTQLTGITSRPGGAAGAVQMGWPTAEYANLVAVAGAVPWGAYGGIPGSVGALCPLGTSVSVSEISTTPGRHGRGRHYLPFFSVGNVVAGGTLNPLTITNTLNAFKLMMGLPPQVGVGAPAVVPAITSGVAGAPYFDVTDVKPQAIMSNLASRRR